MYKTKILISYCTILICMMAFYNKFPLLTPDSGLYIDSGFSKKYLFSMYGFFVAHSSWGKSLWPVVICQSGLLSISFYFWFKYLSPSRTANLFYMCCIFIITFCMSGSVVSSTISPGVFKGIGILSLGLILLVKNINKQDYWIIVSILLFSGLVDFGTALSIITLSIIWALLKLTKYTKLNGQMTFKSFVVPTVCVVLLCFFYYQGRTYWLKGYEWRVTKIGFFTKTDLLPKYLDRKTKGNKFQDEHNALDIRLTKESQIKTGHSSADIRYLENIVTEMCSQPGYTERLIKTLFQNFVKQSINIPIELYPIQYHGSDSFRAVYRWFNWESREYLITRQLQNWLDLRYPGYMQLFLVCFVSIIGLAMLIFRFKSKASAIFLFCYMAYFILAFFNSLLEGAIVKLDNQVAWLLLLPYLVHVSSLGIVQRLSLYIIQMNKKPSPDEI